MKMVSCRLSVHSMSLHRLDRICVRKFTIICDILAVFIVGIFNLFESHLTALKIVMPECNGIKIAAMSTTCIDWDGGWGDTQSHGKSVFNEPWRLFQCVWFLQCGLLNNNNFDRNLFVQNPLNSLDGIDESIIDHFHCFDSFGKMCMQSACIYHKSQLIGWKKTNIHFYLAVPIHCWDAGNFTLD